MTKEQEDGLAVGMTLFVAVMLLYQAHPEFRSWANYKLIQIRAQFRR